MAHQNGHLAPASLGELESALGHTFTRQKLLVEALTHQSLVLEEAQKSGAEIPNPAENERLEFLGDAVLGLVVAEELFAMHPDWREGELTRVRQQFVNRRHMGEVGTAIQLGRYLRVSRGEDRSGLRNRSTVLSNHMEAVLGAVYLDAGLEPVRVFVRRRVLGVAAEKVAKELKSGGALGNYKSALQQHLQAEHLGSPVYRLKSESGPDHHKSYVVVVRLKPAGGGPGKLLAGGKGSSKKHAEQDAARRALMRLTGEKNGKAAAAQS
jgi:ribonuclease-3